MNNYHFERLAQKIFVDNIQKLLYNILGALRLLVMKRGIFPINGDVSMSTELEIERKFLVEMPDLALLDVRRSAHIRQTYLTNGEGGSQRRVRMVTENGAVRYIYTEKVFYTAVTRKETEFDISKEEYDRLLEQIRPDCVPIEKDRVCFYYKEQLFELDAYPFSNELAILELELGFPDQEIVFPPEISVVKEVTCQEAYSNARLANAGAFPPEPEGCE